MEKEEKYKSSMWRITFWIFIVVIVVFIGIFFESINVKLNPVRSTATVISISEWRDIHNTNDYPGLSQRNFFKTYNVTYMYTVNGKDYEGERKMKLKLSIDPLNPANSDRSLGPADVAPINIVYCRHWPSFHLLKD